MYKIEDLFLIYDISVESLEEGITKKILSSPKYKHNIHTKIREKFRQMSCSKHLMRDMSCTFEVLPMTSLSGKWEVKTKDGIPIVGCFGKPLVAYRWTPNYEVDAIINKHRKNVNLCLK